MLKQTGFGLKWVLKNGFLCLQEWNVTFKLMEKKTSLKLLPFILTVNQQSHHSCPNKEGQDTVLL